MNSPVLNTGSRANNGLLWDPATIELTIYFSLDIRQIIRISKLHIHNVSQPH